MGTAANVTIGAASITVDSVDLGFTRGGITVRFGLETKDVKADQLVGTVKTFRTDETMTLSTELLEATLENMRIAFNQPAANLTGTTALSLGYDNSCNVNEHEIILVGKGVSCGTRTWTFYRCVATGERDISLQREEETVIPVEFNVLKDPDNSNKFGTVVDS